MPNKANLPTLDIPDILNVFKLLQYGHFMKDIKEIMSI